jgi:copper(I)-binding protein
MTKLKNWIGLCALLLSLQVYGSEINIQDAWIRPLTPGQEDAMAGMVINSARQARIISVISPAYMFVAIQGPGKSGAKKTQEFEFIDLPAQKSVVLDAESVHLLLSGNRQTLSATDKVPLFVTVQFDDKTSKTITIMAQPAHSKSAAAMPLSSSVATQVSTVTPPTAPRNPVEVSSKVEARTVTPPPQPAPGKAKASPVEAASPAKPVAAPKPPVAEVKPLKTAPVAVPKPAPAPVAAGVAAAPLLVPVAPPVPVAVVAPSVAPLTVEPKKAPEAKPAEQRKQAEARSSAECLSLAVELRECDKLNDMMVAWCETSAKTKYSCQLTMEQLKKLRN